MKFILSIVYFAICTVTAVNYYGDALDNNKIALMEDYAKELENKGLRLVSVFANSDMYNEETTRFLDSIYYTNMTWDQMMNSDLVHTDSSLEVSKRAPIGYECRSNGIVRSSTFQFQVCTALAGLVGGSAAAITLVVDLLTCTGGGRRIKCHATITFTGTTAGTIGVNQVNHYCPGIFNKVNSACNNAGGQAEDTQGGGKINISYGQGKGDCRNQVGNCQVKNN